MSAAPSNGLLLRLGRSRPARPGEGVTTSSVPVDEALLERTSGGDAAALADLYDRHAGRAYSLAWAICRDSGRAEDAVQEAFLSIWRSPVASRSRGGVPVSWLMTVVRSRAIDVLRHDAALHGRNVAVDEVDRVASPDDVSAEVARRLEAEDLQGLMAHLPPEQREAIMLAYFGGLTHTQIARHLGVPYGTVKSRIRLGLEKLRGAAGGDRGAGMLPEGTRAAHGGARRLAAMDDLAEQARRV